MSKNTGNRLLKYGITAGIGLLMAVMCFFSDVSLDSLGCLPAVELMKVLCDAFFVPGTFILMFGLLSWVASEGALDGVGYLGSCLVKTLIPGKRAEFERYGDYVMRKRGSRKTGFGYLCVVGLIFLAIAAIFWMLFYMLY